MHFIWWPQLSLFLLSLCGTLLFFKHIFFLMRVLFSFAMHFRRIVDIYDSNVSKNSRNTLQQDANRKHFAMNFYLPKATIKNPLNDFYFRTSCICVLRLQRSYSVHSYARSSDVRREIAKHVHNILFSLAICLYIKFVFFFQWNTYVFVVLFLC